MVCYFPVQGYRSRHLSEKGLRPVVFNLKDGFQDMPCSVPCGRCSGCRFRRSCDWACRMVNEARYYDFNSFITLTYSEKFIPKGGTLFKRHFQLFMKKLRKRFGDGIKYFYCGEYGSKTRRPHYHAILFNVNFEDKYKWETIKGKIYYRSPILESLWKYGISNISDVTFNSAAYVARYCMKKITGDAALLHYACFDRETGEIENDLLPEFADMSNGIGRCFYDEFKLTDIFNHDFLVINGTKYPMPKYYDDLFKVEFPDRYLQRKIARRKRAQQSVDFGDPYRLRVKEECHNLYISNFKRSLDEIL